MIRKYPGKAMLLTVMASMFGSMALQDHYTRNRPEHPQPELSRTFALPANHGKTVFITEQDKWTLYAILFCGAGAAVVVVVLIYRGIHPWPPE